jgi:hypothetical protein
MADTTMRVPEADSSISATARIFTEPTAGAVGVDAAGTTQDLAAGREVGALHELHEVVDGGVGVGQQVLGGVDDLAQVVGRDVGGHADRDALAAVDQQVREPRRERRRLALVAVEVEVEVDGLLVDAVEHVHRDAAEPALGVAHGRRLIGRRPEVAVGIDEGVAQRERLAETNERVVDGLVAVGVVLAHHVADDTGALHVGAVGAHVLLVHAPEDPAVHRLEAVAGVGQGRDTSTDMA